MNHLLYFVGAAIGWVIWILAISVGHWLRRIRRRNRRIGSKLPRRFFEGLE